MPFRHMISIRKRAKDLVDILIDNQEGNPSFTLEFCQELQGSYGDTIQIPQFTGGKSDSITHAVAYTGHGLPKNVTRFIFNPADVSMDDESVFWIELTVDGGPAAGTQLPFPIISPIYRDRSNFIVEGTAPTGGIEVLLPCVSDEIFIQNTGLTPQMFVKYEENGGEFVVPALGANEPPAYPEKNISRVFMRGDGATASFTLKANLNHAPSYW